MKNGRNSHAAVHYAGNDLFVGITPGGHAQVLETNSRRGSAATPMELLLLGLGGCTAVDVVTVLEKKRTKVTDYRVEVHGHRRAEHPRSFTRMEVRHVLRGERLKKKDVARAIELSETKYCSVAATLRPGVEIVSTFEIIEESQGD